MDESLKKAADLIKEVSNDWKEKDHRCVNVLHALLQLTLDKPEEATQGFTNRELVECVNQHFKYWGDASEGDLASKVNGEWRKLERLWAKKERGLAQRLSAQGINEVPRLKRVTRVGGGHTSSYMLTLVPASHEDSIDDIYRNEHSEQLQYFEDDIDKLTGPARLLSIGFLLGGWGKLLFLSIMMVAILFSGVVLVLFFTGIPQQETFGEGVKFVGSIAIILWAEWSVFGAFFRVVDRRIEVAPWWLQPWSSSGDWLLVFEKNKPASPNAFKLKRYTAKCPACNGVVRIHKGGFSYPNRLVGRCDNSPREHIFSFDHFLRVGNKRTLCG